MLNIVGQSHAQALNSNSIRHLLVPRAGALPLS